MRAVLFLFLLNLRGKARRTLRRLREPGPLILAIIVALVMVFVVLTLSRSGGGNVQGETIAALSPLFMLLMLAGSFSSPHTQRQLFFTSAEVAFLFPGPFSCRHLLALKWVQGLITAMVPALMFAFWMRGGPGNFLTAFLSLWLIFLYLAAVGLALRFVVALVPSSKVRTAGLAGIILLLLGGIWEATEVFAGAQVGNIFSEQGVNGVVELIHSMWLGKVLLAPFKPFGQLLGAETNADFLRWGIRCLALYAGVVGFLFWADIDFRESSLRSSARLEKQLANLKRGQFGAPGPARGRPRLNLPPLPALGGAGAIMWRQLLVGLRGIRGAMIGFLLPLVMLVIMIRLMNGLAEAELEDTFIWGILIWLSVSFSGTGITCDFRADLPHMESLKALPISARAIALGQVLSPTLLLWGLQMLAIGLLAVIGAVAPPIAAFAVLAFLPFNLLLFMSENLAILLFPLHPGKAGVSQVTARGFLVFLIKGAVIGVIGVISGGLGSLAGYAAGSFALGIAVGGIMVLAACTGCLYAIAAAFRRFDVSRHDPAEEG